ncbi:MAG: hypothetical protein C0404_09525 [Verrucomicrobia bacterium]|nr:hypothetical protein [Verrucomicrobiota bacterium]
MANSRIDEAINTVRTLTPFANLENLPPAERMQALQEFIAVGPAKIQVDLQYLVDNLPASDPRRASAQALLTVVSRVINVNANTQPPPVSASRKPWWKFW